MSVDVQKEDNPKQNFGLSYAGFRSLVERLKVGDEQLFERIFVEHFRDCRQYLVYEYKVEADDAYDMTVDTIIKFRELLINDKIDYGNLRYLFTKMAKDAYFKLSAHRKRLPQTELSETSAHHIADSADDAPAFDTEQLSALQNAWVKLGDECKKLLEKHVYEGLQLKQIAEILGESDANVRKRKERCMAKLKTTFFENYVLD
jgi:RNA polymerase sigma factor (sigma-70 family)